MAIIATFTKKTNIFFHNANTHSRHADFALISLI
jgi:hypothetical protein